jgi:pyruvate formate lyase activating enzyme
MEGVVHSFESFGTVDGPGIRFVIFLKGCPFRCMFCHNPDTWTMEGGKKYSTDELVAQVLKYKNYFVNGGGVTVSGGEPTCQMDFLIELFKKFKEKGIHTCLDTSGACFQEDHVTKSQKYDELIKYTDLVLLDIKHIDNEIHKKYVGKPNTGVLAFGKYLSDHGVHMWIRHVLVPGWTLDEKYLRQTREYISTLKTVDRIEVLPYHTLGVKKYHELGIPYPLEGVEPPTKEETVWAQKILRGEI